MNATILTPTMQEYQERYNNSHWIVQSDDDNSPWLLSASKPGDIKKRFEKAVLNSRDALTASIGDITQGMDGIHYCTVIIDQNTETEEIIYYSITPVWEY